MFFSDGVDKFMDYMKAERGASEHTMRAYSSDLAQLGEFLAKRSTRDQVEVDHVGLDDLQDWLQEQSDDKGNVAASLARKISSVRSFWRFMLRKELIDTNPAEMRG